MTAPRSAEEWANEAIGWLVATHPRASGVYADVIRAMEEYARQRVEAEVWRLRNGHCAGCMCSFGGDALAPFLALAKASKQLVLADAERLAAPQDSSSEDALDEAWSLFCVALAHPALKKALEP